MNANPGRVFDEFAARQHGVAAIWQLLQFFDRKAVQKWLRADDPPRVHRGVYGEPVAPFGDYSAAALALGPEAAIANVSGVELWQLIDPEPGDIHVAVPGRGGREPRTGIIVHRPERVVKVHRQGIPVMTPTQCRKDANLPRHHRYVALERADRLWLTLDRQAPFLNDLNELRQTVRGTTRSPAEARFLLLCHDNGLELPLVNHRLNGFETDFHWPQHKLVVEVDGWEFHKERAQFEEDRRRGLAHRIAGHEVIRASALQVELEPATVLAALLAAGLSPRSRRRSRRPRPTPSLPQPCS